MFLFSINKEIKECVIYNRENRFLVNTSIGKVHINNTGKLKDLLVNGAKGLCYKIEGKKTKYRLYAIKEKERYIIIDPILHSKSFEIMVYRNYFSKYGITEILKKEYSVSKNIKIDYLTNKGYVELKSSTLKKGIYTEYPDTFTKRGEKHIKFIIENKGYLIFVSGISSVKRFRINKKYGSNIIDILSKYKEKMKNRIIAYNLELKNKNKIYFKSFLDVDI